MASDGREERRRKILERGSDRLAVITGQSKSVHTSPSPESLSSDHRQSSPDVDGIFAHESFNDKANNGVSQANNAGFTRLMEHELNSHDASTAAGAAPILIKKEHSGVTPSAQVSTGRLRLFSSKRINSCILSSQRTRAICSLIIASLVVVSYVGYPLFGINVVRSESIIAYRPLYMLLITDVTIVIIRIFRERISSPEEAEEVKPVAVNRNEGDNWEDAVKLMERGLVVYQAIRGIFIDCSVYLVVVICFLSFV